MGWSKEDGAWVKEGEVISASEVEPGDQLDCVVGDDGTYNVTKIVRPTVDEKDTDGDQVSDGFHTFEELYHFRMLYHAYAVREWDNQGLQVVKSWNHSDGEPCFGGGWFVVVAELPDGQVSNHYRQDYWDLFQCEAVPTPPKFDGHGTQDVLNRLKGGLQ